MNPHEAFFANLPPNDLLPIEHELRRVLLDFIMQHPTRQFPVAEWIDRRIGGEVATQTGMNGQVECRMRSAPPMPPPGSGAFGPPGWSTMPPHVMPGAWPGGPRPPAM